MYTVDFVDMFGVDVQFVLFPALACWLNQNSVNCYCPDSMPSLFICHVDTITHTHTHFPSLSAAFISLGSVVFWQWGGIFGLGAQSLTVFVALFWTLSCECICVVFATRIKGLLQFNCCLSFGFLYLRAPLSLRSLGCVFCISCPDVRSVCSAVSCVRGGFLLRSYN